MTGTGGDFPPSRRRDRRVLVEQGQSRQGLPEV